MPIRSRARVTLLCRALIVTPLAASSAAAQAGPAFETAAIKPSAIWKAGGEGSSRARIEHSPKSLTMRNVNLSDCVQWAYLVEAYQIKGEAALPEDRYDILAKSGEAVSVSALRVMLQRLLADRFQLSLHRDSKTIDVYALRVANGGSKLPAAKDDRSGELQRVHTAELLPRVEGGSFVFAETSMPEFAKKLGLLRGIDRPVIDQTRISGFYDITLKSAAQAIRDNDTDALFAMLQNQLGLRLIATKAPVDVLVINHANKIPLDN